MGLRGLDLRMKAPPFLEKQPFREGLHRDFWQSWLKEGMKIKDDAAAMLQHAAEDELMHVLQHADIVRKDTNPRRSTVPARDFKRTLNPKT